MNFDDPKICEGILDNYVIFVKIISLNLLIGLCIRKNI